MSKLLLDVSFDVFFSILELADPETLLAVGQCNRQCREWAGNPLLWKEIIRRMQEHGVQFPVDGFTGIDQMSLDQLKRCALRACRIRHKWWSSKEAHPSNSFLIDCNPYQYQHGAFHTNRRIGWIIPITDHFFAIKLGYEMTNGFVQIWHRDAEAPQFVMNYRYNLLTWGSFTDLAEKAWYFIYSELDPNQCALHLMRFFGFESNPRVGLEVAEIAKYPTYGSIINVFVLSVARRALCVLYSGSPSGNVTLFFVPDWHKRDSAHIDTGIEDNYPTHSTFICWMDAGNDQLFMQFERVPKRRVCQYVYAQHDLARHIVPVPAFPFPLPNPPHLEPTRVFEVNIIDTPPNQAPYRELKSLVSFDHHYCPILPNAPGTLSSPLCSHISLASSPGRDLNPVYIFKHVHVGLAGTRPFVQRMVTPAICRMAFEQDYMDRNTTQRFPIGQSLDLRGHELVALGHGCAAWIEARPPTNANVTLSFDQEVYDLKIAMFPWKREEGGESESGGMPKPCGDLGADSAVSVCTVRCPPEVDLARATGLWLDARQGRVFVGLKWAKFVVLQFD